MSVNTIAKRTFACLGVVLSSSALVISLTGFSPASAWGSGGGDGTSQSLGVTVNSVAKCAYSLSGISSSIAMTASKTYNPDDNSQTSLTGSDSGIILSAYPDGNPSTPCSFYGSSSAGKIIVSVPSTPTWSGTVTSTTLSWTNDNSNKLNLVPTGGADCTSSGATLATLGLFTGSVSGNLVTITSSSAPKACTVGNSISSLIPKGLNSPQGAKTYSVTGPTITYTLSLS